VFNPLLPSLSDLTISQLEDRVVDLQRKYFQTSNPNLKQQIVVNLNTFKEEISYRRGLERQRQQEEMNKDGDNGLDNLINIS